LFATLMSATLKTAKRPYTTQMSSLVVKVKSLIDTES